MSRLARINVVPGWTMQHKTSRSCAASCRIYCALTKPPRSASRTSGSRPDSMNTIGLECLECRSLDAIALARGAILLDKAAAGPRLVRRVTLGPELSTATQRHRVDHTVTSPNLCVT